MYPLEPNPNALDIIARSVSCHPATLCEALESHAKDALAYAALYSAKQPRRILTAQTEAARRAIGYITDGDFDKFADDRGAGRLALRYAAVLQGVSYPARLRAMWAAWGRE